MVVDKKDIKKYGRKYGPLIFLAGLLVALLASLIPSDAIGTGGIQLVTGFLLLVGLVVGLFNITESESQLFLIAGIALMLAFSGLLAAIDVIFVNTFVQLSFVSSMLAKVQVMIAPAVGIVAIKTIYDLAKDV